MDWEQISELRDAGMIIGSHGMSHKILVGMNDEELEYELRESKSILKEKLGSSVEFLSVPRGLYDARLIRHAREAGYKFVFTSGAKDRGGFKLGRIAVRRDWNLDHFTGALNDDYPIMDKLNELAKNSAKLVLGAKNYDKLRTILLAKS